MEYEVYVASFNGLVLYVGEGRAGRHVHVNSGISHVFNLNRFFFQYGRIDLDIEPIATKELAESRELQLIEELQPFFNNRNSKNNHGKDSDITFYEALSEISNDGCLYELRLMKEVHDHKRSYKYVDKEIQKLICAVEDNQNSLLRLQLDNIVIRVQYNHIVHCITEDALDMVGHKHSEWLLNHGHTTDQVALLLGLPESTIKRWVKSGVVDVAVDSDML